MAHKVPVPVWKGTVLWVSQVPGRLIGSRLRPPDFKGQSPPLFRFFTLKNYMKQIYRKILFLNPSFTNNQEYKMSHYHIKDNFNSFNTINNVSNNYAMADEKSQILAWLSPLEPQRRHHDIRTRRVDEVGNWLLQTEEYRNWSSAIGGGRSDGSALFCYGGPGVGKTYIR